MRAHGRDDDDGVGAARRGGIDRRAVAIIAIDDASP